MAKYRYKDKTETNSFGQTLGYVSWMGGVELTYVGGVLCADGCKRNWFKTDDHAYANAIPGYVHVKGKKIHGCIMAEYATDTRIEPHFKEVKVEGIRYKFHEWPKSEDTRVIPRSMPNY